MQTCRQTNTQNDATVTKQKYTFNPSVHASHAQWDNDFRYAFVHTNVRVHNSFFLTCIILTRYMRTAVNGQSPIITSLPESLFGASGGVHSVVEGSVIQLYCSVELAIAIVSWTRENVQVIIDVPHLCVRTSSNGTHNTSVLTLDNFRSGDDGTYQCHAMSGGVTESGSTVSFTGETVHTYTIHTLHHNNLLLWG